MSVILCDVDLTVVDPIPFWWQWLEAQTNMKQDFYQVLIENDGGLSYDVSRYFQPSLENNKVDPLDFWRNEGIYDFLYPLKDSVKVLKDFHRQGHQIRFVSHCKGNHHKSKYAFLKRNFPFMQGFAATKEKYMLESDVFIDDRIKHLNNAPLNTNLIQMASPYTQEEDYKRAIRVAVNWEEIGQMLENII